MHPIFTHPIVLDIICKLAHEAGRHLIIEGSHRFSTYLDRKKEEREKEIESLLRTGKIRVVKTQNSTIVVRLE